MAEGFSLVLNDTFALPAPIAELISARNKLRHLYSTTELKFTIDGNLVGDIGEAIAAQLFNLRLVSSNSTAIDALTSDGRSVQIKATGTNRGPAFRLTELRADHLIFLKFDFENLLGEVVYNGPEHRVIQHLPSKWSGQRAVSMTRIKKENALVHKSERLLHASLG